MHSLRLSLAIGLAVMTALAGCKKGNQSEPKATDKPPITEPPKPEPPRPEPPRPEPPRPPEPAEPANTTDATLTPVRLNLEEHTWKPVPALPKGAQMAVLEGEPPFPEGKSFAFLAKLPKDYQVPPHTHLLTERVTVLSGSLHFGHGEKLDKTKGKEIKAGGIMLIPAGHAHFVWTTGEVVIHVQGVGPWNIFYIDPKDDPRKPAPEKPATMDHPTDTDLADAVAYNMADIKWSPGPPSLPPGTERAVLEGTPPFGPGKSFVFRAKLPDGFKIPVNSHMVTARIVVLSGTLKHGLGDKWNDADMKAIKPGGVVYLPRGQKSFDQAQGETILQLQGVGPWDIIYANPDDDPRNKKK